MKEIAKRPGFAACALVLVAANAAFAQDLVYSPVNPSFGGSPLNSSHLLNIANAQREATAFDANDGDDGFGDEELIPDDNGDVDLFVRQLEGRLFSALAGQVTEAIFGASPQDNGTVVFGSTTVEFSRSASEIRLTVIDALDGSVTEIIVPQLVVN